MAKQMVVEKVQMTPWQPRDLRKGVVDALGVKRSPAFEERVLVAEVAMLRTAAADDDRIGNEIEMAIDQVAANGRHALQRSIRRRHVTAIGPAGAEIIQKLRKRLFPRAEEDDVGMPRRLIGQ